MSRYQIRYDGNNIVGDISYPEYVFYDAVLDEEINSAGTLTFTILDSNPALPSLALRKSTISLYRDGAEIWRGRIVRIEIDMRNRRIITCEGALAWFYDILQRGYAAGGSGDTPDEAITKLLAAYNAECSTSRQIAKGMIGPTRVWYPQLANDYFTIFDLLAQLLANSGGYYSLRYGSTLYLDYNNFGSAATGQPVVFGENLFDVARALEASEVATTLYAEDSAGHAVTVTNAAMESAFGKSQIYHHFEDCDNATALAALATEWFNNNCMSKTTIEVSALDLSLTSQPFASFYIGQPVQIISTPHGLNTTMILTGLRTNISNPEASQLTLGSMARGVTSYLVSSGAKSGNGSSSDYVTTISPTFTQSGGNSTLTVTAARKCGRVVQIGFNISITGNVAEGENIWSGTLSNYLPVAYISTASYYGVATPSAGVFRITAAGDVNFRLVKGALTNGATMYCGLTYLTLE